MKEGYLYYVVRLLAGEEDIMGNNNRYHLLSAFYVLGTVLSLALHFYLILPRAPSFLK